MAAEGASAAEGGGAAAAGAVPKSKGVLLAIAIVLLWLAGLAFFIALEGSHLLGESATPDGGGYAKAIVSGLGKLAQQRAGSTAGSTGNGPTGEGEGGGGPVAGG